MKIERRLYPRQKAVLPIVITMPDGEIITSTTINISMVGIQLECDQKDASRIFSVSESEKAIGKPIELNTTIQLPVEPESSAKLSLVCRIVISVRLEENIYQIGLKYINLSGDQKQVLEKYLQQLIQSR